MRYLLFILLALGLSSCTKEEYVPKGPSCNDPGTRYISGEISNFKYKKGSYWVFVDSVSMVTDTMRIDTTYSMISAYQYCPDSYYEYYGLQTNQKTDNSSQFDIYSLTTSLMTLNQRSENGYGYAIYTDATPEVDSLFIYDRYYKKVVKTSLGPAGENTVFYINTTEGFLKKEVYRNNQLISKKCLKNKYILR